MIDTPFPNQPPAFEGGNPVLADVALREGLHREGAGWSEDDLIAFGAHMGAVDTYALADTANRHPPRLELLDRRGERLDSVEFHPAWHALMRIGCTAGEHVSPWSVPRPGAQVARAALVLVHGQVENGTQCPITMTYASVPALAAHATAASGPVREWLAVLCTHDYDPRPLPILAKRAALIGMGMTERQGGSDVRSNRTRALPVGDGSFRLTGHKWFFSAPQCDAHLVLARDEAGVSAFALPRFLPDGARNRVRLQRLKDKLGNRSNASAEVEFDDAIAWPLGEAGRGVATILTMVQHTRLDCVLGSAALMRAALAWAMHHARHRIAFGQVLASAPLMQSVLADLALESEAATALGLRLARTFEAERSEADAALARVLTPAAKFWVCKRASACTAEAMEVLGGNGYVEEQPLPRFYREAPVNSIWEGSGNVIALDVQRALTRDTTVRDALFGEIALARGGNHRLDAAAEDLRGAFDRLAAEPACARRLAQTIALAVQGALLVRFAPPATSDAFCATRLHPDHYGGAVFGALPASVDAGAILARACADAPT